MQQALLVYFVREWSAPQKKEVFVPVMRQESSANTDINCVIEFSVSDQDNKLANSEVVN